MTGQTDPEARNEAIQRWKDHPPRDNRPPAMPTSAKVLLGALISILLLIALGVLFLATADLDIVGP
jgi:hypothetical protein